MKKTFLQSANSYFRGREYSKAIDCYKMALIGCNHQFLREQIISNLELAEKRQKNIRYSGYSVDVIIPVYNALDDVRKCLSSVQDSQKYHPLKIILVNDGSDNETSIYLREFSENSEFVELIEHEVNKGYTKAVNAGLRCSRASYLVTLNSDTIVPKNWIQSLLDCINSDPKRGIVGPLSNAASWQNFPSLLDEAGKFAINDIPELFTLDSLNEFLGVHGSSRYPEVPFVNGFCFMIKREVIDSIGYMDEEAFPVGYGEENDFCLRALKSNFKLAIADNVYVYHAKSKSFGHTNRQKLSKQGGDRLKAKHGAKYFQEKVNLIKNNSALRDIRRECKNIFDDIYDFSSRCSSKSNIKIGFLLPVGGGGGGANSVVQEASEMEAMGFDVHVYVPDMAINKLLEIYADIKNIANILVPYRKNEHRHWTVSSLKNRDLNIHYLVRNRSVLVATMHTTVELLDEVLQWNKSIMPAYYAQDYEPLFHDPVIEKELYEQALESYTKIPNNVIFAKTDWIRSQITMHHSTCVEKVKPSIDESLYYECKKSNSKNFSILAMIRPRTPRRGAANTMKLLKTIKDMHGNAVEINIFGCNDYDDDYIELERNFAFVNHGILRREQVAALTHRSNLFIDLSTYQAFGRTGLEAMASGCISILPKSGGADEYVKDGVNSFAIDYKDNGRQILSIVSRLINDRPYFEKIRNEALKTASEYSVRSAAMSEIAVFSKYLKTHAVHLSLSKMTIIYCPLAIHGAVEASVNSRLRSWVDQCKLSNKPIKIKPITDKFFFTEKFAKEIVFHGFYDNLTTNDLGILIRDHQSYGARVIYHLDDCMFDIGVLVETGMHRSRAEFIVEQVKFFISSVDLVLTSTRELADRLSNRLSTPVRAYESIAPDALRV